MERYRAGNLDLKDFELDVQAILAAHEREGANKRKKTLERDSTCRQAAGVFDDGPDDFQVHAAAAYPDMPDSGSLDMPDSSGSPDMSDSGWPGMPDSAWPDMPDIQCANSPFPYTCHGASFLCPEKASESAQWGLNGKAQLE